MGFFGCWILAYGATEERLRSLGFELIDEGGTSGWLLAELDYERAEELDELVASASGGSGAAVGALVHDSDFGYVVAAREGAVAAQVIVEPARARSYDFDVRSDPEAFARWTAVAPSELGPADVRKVLGRRWVLAEDGVHELLGRAGLAGPRAAPAEPVVPRGLGLEELAGLLRPVEPGSTFRLVQRELPLAQARFVAGYGDRFIGVWDRKHPSEPVASFPEDDYGHLRAAELVYELLFEHELPRKRLPATRSYLPRGPAWSVGDLLRPRGSTAGWSGPWLLTEEDADDRWRPTIPAAPGARWYLYSLGGDASPRELALSCSGAWKSREEAEAAAARQRAQGEWSEVPEEVARDLLATARWLVGLCDAV